MNHFYVTRAAMPGIVRANARAGWYVLQVSGCTFKIFGLWAQVMETPDGQRASGVSGHKSQKAFITELAGFIGRHGSQTQGGV